MDPYDDDDDAFLYGTTTGTSGTTTAPPAGVTKAEAASIANDHNVNPPISLTENGTAATQADDAGEQDMDEGSDDDEEDEESEDDLEIILDVNPNAPPSVHHQFARQAGAIPVKPIPPSAVQAQNDMQAREQALQASEPSQSTPATQDAAKPEADNPFLSFNASVHATGATVPMPARRPPPNVNDLSAAYAIGGDATEADGTDGTVKPEPQPIIDIEPEQIEDKRWRKAGAYLADYFNYGFDEATWIDWCKRQRISRKERQEEKDNPFHVFANRPLADAWNALPMELKGMMMQTIMSSFSNPAAGGMGMGMGMGGMNMGGMGMGSMNMSNMGNMMMGGMMNNNNNFGSGNMGSSVNQMMGGQQMSSQNTALQPGSNSGMGSKANEGGEEGPTAEERESNYDEDAASEATGDKSQSRKRGASNDFAQQPQNQHGFRGSRGGGFQQGNMPNGPRGGRFGRGAGRGQGGYNNNMGNGRNGPVQGVLAPRVRALSPLPSNLPTGPRNRQGSGQRR